jgi:Na+/melibiose symporter-like transporter
MLGLGAIPALSVFYLLRKIRETPRFVLAQMEAREQEQQAAEQGPATGLRGILTDRRTVKWLVGASLAWFLFDIVYYGNTISSPIIVDLAAPDASVMQQIAIALGIFAVFALPGYALAAATVDRIGHKLLQIGGFLAIAVAFALLWVIPGATSTLVTFIVLFGAASMGTLLTGLGLGRTSLLVAAVALAGAFVALLTLPEPSGRSLEDIGPDGMPSSAVTLGVAESRGTRPPPATSRHSGR